MEAIDTLNQFNVGMTTAGQITVGQFPRHGLLTREQALNLSAWLQVLADPTGERISSVVEAVENS